MKPLVLLLTLMLSTSVSAQTLQCPPDTVYSALDFLEVDNNFEEPIVTGVGTLVSDIEYLDKSCADTSIILNIRYTLSDLNDNPIAACTHCVKAINATFDDIIYPADVIIENGKLSDTVIDSTGVPNFYINSFNLFFEYQDLIINTPNAYKIIRTWTALNWCTGELDEHLQIINLRSQLNLDFGEFLAYDCANNDSLIIRDVRVVSDLPNINIDQGNCIESTMGFAALLNCVAELNNIPDNSHLVLDINYGEDEVLNGVSTLDLVISQRHILGQSIITDRCKLIAADANGDGSITALDLFIIRRLILGVIEEFPQSGSWQFFKLVSNETNNSINEIQELKFSKEDFPLNYTEIIGVKIGDVNGSR